MQRITSRENPQIKRFVAIASDKAEREQAGAIAVEGARLCLDALKSGLAFNELFATETALRRYPELNAVLEKSNESFIISEPVASKMSDTKTPQGIFALCEMPRAKSHENHKHDARYLLLASLQDAGNVGTVIRTAEAFGLDGIAMTSDCPDIYSPKVLRASMGGSFRLPVRITGDMTEEITRLKSQGVAVYAAALQPGAKKLGAVRFEGACAVLFGNEGAGLEAKLVAACDCAVTIPMAGQADSLSVAIAAGIFAWEMKR